MSCVAPVHQPNNERPLSPALLRFVCKWIFGAVKFQDVFLEDLACKAMRWRGHSKFPIHPKHLFDKERAEANRKQLRAHIRFLDLGSGAGSECIEACKAGAIEVVGLELNENSLEQARVRAESEGCKVEFFKQDLESPPYPLKDDHFDLVNFSNVLEHLHNCDGVLCEIRRVLKAEGVAFISIPNTGTRWKRLLRAAGLDSRDDKDHKIEYTRETLEVELANAGLVRTTELEPIVPSLPINGMVAMSALVSPSLYRRLQRWKRSWVKKHPEESIGWYFHVSEGFKGIKRNL